MNEEEINELDDERVAAESIQPSIDTKKRTMKIQHIDCCDYCKYCNFDTWDDWPAFCEREQRDIDTEGPNESNPLRYLPIPDWCPLPEADMDDIEKMKRYFEWLDTIFGVSEYIDRLNAESLAPLIEIEHS